MQLPSKELFALVHVTVQMHVAPADGSCLPQTCGSGWVRHLKRQDTCKLHLCSWQPSTSVSRPPSMIRSAAVDWEPWGGTTIGKTFRTTAEFHQQESTPHEASTTRQAEPQAKLLGRCCISSANGVHISRACRPHTPSPPPYAHSVPQLTRARCPIPQPRKLLLLLLCLKSRAGRSVGSV